MVERASLTRGLERADALYQSRDLRAKELKKQGKKVVGYVCPLVPMEFLTAAELVPLRISGSPLESITEADAYVETIMCPYLRSCFDKGLKGDYQFLDGFVAPHGCDHLCKMYDIWRYYLKPTYSHFVNIPHMDDASCREFFHRELQRFQMSLEEFTGVQLSSDKLQKAIEQHNRSRALVRELYQLRKPDPPLVSGAEVTRVLVAVSLVPVEEGNQLLEGVIQDVSTRGGGPAREDARILLYGAELDNSAFVELVEESGSNVVMDDLCLGTRQYWRDVPVTPDPLEGLISHYLQDVTCPRNYKPRLGTHEEDLENRFGYLRDFVRDFKVNSAIVYVIRYCDIFEFDAPDVRDFLKMVGVPVLHIEEDYLMTNLPRLKTRVQAFLETLV